MDMITIESIVEVVSFVTFVGIVLWAYSGRRKEAFEAAAQLPMEDDEFERHADALAMAKMTTHNEGVQHE